MSQCCSRQGRSQNLGDAHAEVVIQNEHFPACDEAAVHQNVDRVARQLVERHDRTFPQLENFFDQQLGPTQFDTQVELDVFQIAQVAR